MKQKGAKLGGELVGHIVLSQYAKTADIQSTLTKVDTQGTVTEAINAAITNLAIGDYAKAADLLAHAGRVTTLEGKVKTLEETTITNINKEIDDVKVSIEGLEEVTHTHENKSVLDDISADKVTAWDGAVTDRHTHDNKTALDLVTEDKITAWDKVSEKVDQSEFNSVKTTIDEHSTTLAGIPAALDEKVSKKSEQYTNLEGVTATVEHRLLTPAEQEKLSKLVLNEDGSVETGTSVAAGDVVGLADWLKTNGKTHIEGLTTSNLSDDLVTQIEGAINQVTVDGKVLTKTNGAVDIPVATTTALPRP